MMGTEATSLGHPLFTEIVGAETMLCVNYPAVVLAKPGAKLEGANGAAFGLRRAPCQKCLGFNDMCSFQTIQRSARGSELSFAMLQGEQQTNLQFPSCR